MFTLTRTVIADLINKVTNLVGYYKYPNRRETPEKIFRSWRFDEDFQKDADTAHSQIDLGNVPFFVKEKKLPDVEELEKAESNGTNLDVETVESG